MPFTLLVGPGTESPSAAVEERSFDKPIVTIGRGATCDLILKDVRRAVSSRHAEIRRKDDSHVLVDTRSTNGTFLNHEKLTTAAVVITGDHFKCGNTSFGIQVEESDSFSLSDVLYHSPQD